MRRPEIPLRRPMPRRLHTFANTKPVGDDMDGRECVAQALHALPDNRRRFRSKDAVRLVRRRPQGLCSERKRRLMQALLAEPATASPSTKTKKAGRSAAPSPNALQTNKKRRHQHHRWTVSARSALRAVRSCRTAAKTALAWLLNAAMARDDGSKATWAAAWLAATWEVAWYVDRVLFDVCT